MKSSTKLIFLTTLFLMGIVKAQLSGCSFEGNEIENCLIQQEGSLISPKPCCAALNQAIKVGFSCLCSLITTTNVPHLNILLSGSLTSGCEISIPPLTLCQGFAPTPVFLPNEPEFREDQLSPFFYSPKGLNVVETQPPPPFSEELYVPLSHSSSLENGEASTGNWDWFKAFNMQSSGENKDRTFKGLILLIFSVVCVELLLV